MCKCHNLTQYKFTRLLQVYSFQQTTNMGFHFINFHLSHSRILPSQDRKEISLPVMNFVLLLWSKSCVFYINTSHAIILQQYTSDIFASKYWDEYAFFVYFEKKNNFIVFSAVFALLINKNYHISVKFRNFKAIVESSKNEKCINQSGFIIMCNCHCVFLFLFTIRRKTSLKHRENNCMCNKILILHLCFAE